MDRRRSSLWLLLLFVACTGIAIAVSGSRPSLDQGTAPWLIQVIGYLCAVAGGVLLLAPPAGQDAEVRRLGFVVLGAVVVLALLDALTMADDGGANIGAGFVRLLALVVVMVATIRLAQRVAGERRAR